MVEPYERYAAAAVTWALARVGDPSYALRCLAFVEDAYERANGIEVFGGDTARESATRYGVTPYDVGAPPAAGSLVFYACGGPVEFVWREWGHVGVALGDGRVVHAWDHVRVDAALDVELLTPADGWQRPSLIGWTSAERVLEGHRPRSWDVG